ncbi:MAG: XRE family transcriptional regulator [Anaeroplasmataceae bacterium]|nr:XRE family transcriptional regulator [Anaeroplasmataceae bacterium]
MNLGNKIRERRTLLMLTQEELANRCELTKGYISQLENDKVSPSIETLEIILDVLGTSFSDFFHEDTTQRIVFAEEDQYTKEFEGYEQTWLVPTSQEHALEPILVEIAPHKNTIHDYPHPGEEFGFVIKGEIIVHYGNIKRSCKEGESFYIITNSTHYLENITDKPARLVWVSTPPNF